jgi:large subunit ribosomal protein L21
MADGEEFLVGTPTVSGINVKATVVEHFRGPKVFRFKYSPKKRIRVRGGHRQQYTRLMVDFIGLPGEVRKVEKPVEVEPAVETEVEAAPKVEKKQAKVPAKEAKASAVKKAPAKKPAPAKSTAKPAAKKSAAKK